MAQRKVSILDKAAEEVAYVAYFIESKGLPKTAKKFVDDSFGFFQRLGDAAPNINHAAFRPGKRKDIVALGSYARRWSQSLKVSNR
jgi:hypothetical protein